MAPRWLAGLGGLAALIALVVMLTPEGDDTSEIAQSGSAASPSARLPYVHGKPASFVQQLQLQTATALGKPVVYRDTLKSGGEGPEMVVIPAGRFLMGSPTGEPGRSGDEHQHSVTISQPFVLGKTEVTFAEYNRFVEATGHDKRSDGGWGDRGDRPVINVSWTDAQAYAVWLSEQTGQRYRLPTEAEWEYAARAGSHSAFSWGDELTTAQANYTGQWKFGEARTGEYRGKILPVTSFQPNAWGLYQMHGNVGEWVADWQGDYSTAAVTDPTGPDSGIMRVLRGGGWNDDGHRLRAAARFGFGPEIHYSIIGFRLAGD